MSEKLRVLYFSATWCGPCKIFKPAFNEVVGQYNDIDVQMIDIDETPLLAQEYLVSSIPTVVMLKGDEQIFRQAGIMAKTQLKNLIENNK